MEQLEYLLLGSAGAAAAEMLKLYQRRGSLTDAKFNKMMRSVKHWLLLAGMILSSGFIAWAVHTGSSADVWPVVLSGIGASALIRLPPQAVNSNRKLQLGDDDSEESSDGESFTVRDFFS